MEQLKIPEQVQNENLDNSKVEVGNISPFQIQANIDNTSICDVPAKSIGEILDELLALIKADNPAAAGGYSEVITLKTKDLVVITTEFVKEIAQKHNWDLAEYQGGFIAFNGKYWVKVNEEMLKNFLGKAAENIGINELTAKHYTFRNALLSQFIQTSYFKTALENDFETKINLCNGTFVITKDKQFLKKYDKNDYLMYMLNFPFDGEAKAPMFQQYLDEVLPNKDKQAVLAEFIGYSFIRNSVLKLEKAAILLGSGANGKSVFFDIISGLLGRENISNVSLQTLSNPSFYAKPLIADKLLNYSSEISTKMDTTDFKTLISGEPIAVRAIREKSFIMRNYARFMFNANELPSDIEHNHGFFRRFLIIEFDKTIQKEKMDVNLANKIVNSELSGVFNWALAGLNRILNQNGFSKCDEIDEAVLNFRKESDAVNLFIEEYGYINSQSEKMALKDLYSDFKKYCKEYNYQIISNKSFSKRLKSYGFSVQRLASGRVVYLTKAN